MIQESALGIGYSRIKDWLGKSRIKDRGIHELGKTPGRRVFRIDLYMGWWKDLGWGYSRNKYPRLQIFQDFL